MKNTTLGSSDLIFNFLGHSAVFPYSYKPVKHGFTLIEVVVAMGILMVIIMSVFSLISFSTLSLKNSEMQDTAKNVATYCMEYIRSKNITSDNNIINTSDWYSSSNKFAKFPGLIDLSGNALSINLSPALPDQKYSDKANAFYSSLQGFVSLSSNPVNSVPSTEDPNAKVVAHKYLDINTGNPYTIRFPIESSEAKSIKNFSTFTGYNSLVYTINNKYVDKTKYEYDPHYVMDKNGTLSYNGFRVLTQIVARATAGHTEHVQYYDVKVTVFWILTDREHSYSISSQITTYGIQ